MLDSKLKPWVLEVNHSPSFTCDSDLDKEIKGGVISGAMKLLNLNGSSQKKHQKQEKYKSQSRLWKRGSVGTANIPNTIILPELNIHRNLSSRIQNNSANVLETVSSSVFTNKSEIINTAFTNSNIASAVLFPVSPPESPDGPKQSKMSKYHKLEALEKAFEEYLGRYDKRLLSKLSRFEDIHMGNYQRIFPPNDLKTFKQYVYLISENGKLSSETNATKARKLYLEQRKVEALDKQRAVNDWKVKNDRLTHIQG
jgi:hypothetical protein